MAKRSNQKGPSQCPIINLSTAARGPFKSSGTLGAFVSLCVVIALAFAFSITRGAADPVKPPYIQFIGHTADLTDAEYSADGKRVLTASSDKTARIWNAANGVLAGDVERPYGGGADGAFQPRRVRAF